MAKPPLLLRQALRPVLRALDSRIDRRIRHTGGERGRTVTELRRAVEELRAEVSALRSGGVAGVGPGGPPNAADPAADPVVRATVEAIFGPEGRRDRRVDPDRMRMLAAELADLGDPRGVAPREVVIAHRTLVEVENRGVGRVAGSTPNIVGKLAAVPLLRPPNGEILEIGCLYGLFAGALVRQVLRSGSDYRLTLVDPVAPRQLQGGRELREDASGVPITEALVRSNLALAGVDPDRTRLCRGLSGDPEVRAAASDRSYGLVVVDGDHTAEGVAADLEWVETITAPGAVVVLDDYGARQWPGVQEATDRHLKRGDGRLEWVGRVATSAFLRAR
ncbi:class I SAM-dependent methyltransferase [Streptomyces alkaliphilus]|uniref:class I SAM-dependent methyltransferase n=1 Tax=Streptomyces alkaliphilus TaxID=1472722 RepID=UPI00117C2E49|nr:class I SAM-dependent methyltransferase [Streptomyces alkaliphilus]MQS07708.1 class I SAM-dependent methyltransferase [Streptomyces alkaliphilus]